MLATLLIVDDYRDTLEMVQELFELEGRIVRTAASAREAIESMERFQSDVVWIDEDLWDMVGNDLAKALKAISHARYGSPVTALTIRSDHMHVELCMFDGFDELVSKPIDFLELQQLLLRCDRKVTEQADGVRESKR
ncbi:response regulator [Acidovorax sp. LjRoot194]|uniref:response regulator n=1 Tax=Acidovorax sp. LjRoot194 TaxID=3342280 RepID=UPI003ECE572D